MTGRVRRLRADEVKERVAELCAQADFLWSVEYPGEQRLYHGVPGPVPEALVIAREGRIIAKECEIRFWDSWTAGLWLGEIAPGAEQGLEPSEVLYDAEEGVRLPPGRELSDGWRVEAVPYLDRRDGCCRWTRWRAFG